jgi:membrane-associated phospholipid phosphatase
MYSSLEMSVLSPDSLKEEEQENMRSVVKEAEQEVAASRRPWYYLSRIARLLLGVYTLLLLLFGALAWWVHSHSVLPIDVTITREFQENLAPWLQVTMRVISYPGSSLLLPLLVVAAALIFWVVGLRLEAVFVLALSVVSFVLNTLLKILVARPRPTGHLVDVFQASTGNSFPSGHVMAYLAFWGLLFSFGIILFTGKRWWRILLLVVSALFIVLIGPARIYLGDHWASDVLGSYLIGGVLLGMALWVYLQLKQRGVLETKRTRERTDQSRVLRTFPRR